MLVTQAERKQTCSSEGAAQSFFQELEQFENSINQVAASRTLMIGGITCCGILVLLYAMFVVYLGVYGYANPDPESCFYIDRIDTPSLTREGAEEFAKEKGIDVRPGYPVDMAHLFRSWFLWGFWSHIVGLVVQLVFVPMFFLCRVSSAAPHLTYMVLQGANCCNLAAWFLMGFFWRFSRAGRIVSGEKIERAGLQGEEWQQKLREAQEANGYQIRGGRFMSVFVWLILGGLFVAIAAGSIAAVVMCMDSEGQREYEKLRRSEQGEGEE